MSFEVISYEKLTINNIDENTNKVVQKLKEYILQFHTMLGAEAMDIYRMILRADDQIIEISDVSESEFGNTYILTNAGLRARQVKHIQWEDDSPIMLLLGNLEKAKDISFEISFRVMQLSGVEYGYSYWYGFESSLRNHIEYRCLEYYDTSDELTAYLFNKNFDGDVLYDASKEDVSGISRWFSYNFELVVDSECEDEPNEAFTDELYELALAFSKKYEMNEPEKDYYIGDALVFGGLVVSTDQVDVLIDDLKKIETYVSEHGFEISVMARFTPDTEYEFAAMEIKKDPDLKAVYCRF